MQRGLANAEPPRHLRNQYNRIGLYPQFSIAFECGFFFISHNFNRHRHYPSEYFNQITTRSCRLASENLLQKMRHIGAVVDYFGQ